MKECSIKSAKRKQRRKAQFSRAADAELAEISLEQQVLRGMTAMMLTLQPAGDKLIKDCSQSSSVRPSPYLSLQDSSVSYCRCYLSFC